MPSSPRTPRHSRGPSAIDISIASPTPSPTSNRRSSKASLQSPRTPRTSFTRSDSIGIDVFSSGGAPPENGLGNLADELADAWDDDEEDGDDPDLNFHQPDGIDELERVGGEDNLAQNTVAEQTLDTLALPVVNPKGHRRKGSDYDGSDYGEDSDVEDTGMPTSLVSRMDAVESLARRDAESNGSQSDDVVKRVVNELKDLGTQSGVEGSTTRSEATMSAPQQFANQFADSSQRIRLCQRICYTRQDFCIL